jgi:hypothetical protein
MIDVQRRFTRELKDLCQRLQREIVCLLRMARLDARTDAFLGGNQSLLAEQLNGLPYCLTTDAVALRKLDFGREKAADRILSNRYSMLECARHLNIERDRSVADLRSLVFLGPSARWRDAGVFSHFSEQRQG